MIVLKLNMIVINIIDPSKPYITFNMVKLLYLKNIVCIIIHNSPKSVIEDNLKIEPEVE